MAAAAPEEKIQEEAKCPICLEYFTDPVSAECGHNFCCVCIIQFCDTGEGEYGRVECPLCRANIREETLRPNWDLARVTECVKTLNIKQREENLCPKHNKSLDLFCEEDRKALCVVCERSLDHAGHKVLLLEEAAEKYQVPRRILVCLDYAGGQVMFVSADIGAEIFTFQSALFKGERICPWFMVENGSAQLHLRP
ncbi:zinc finger protein RFP [Apteryx mantelli]|uniref:RING-type E3 ubiquitin transferase n=1 Tax=Apteryx mantelli TaxID=2696672 RepID=A0ABM4FXQ3_9AVES